MNGLNLYWFSKMVKLARGGASGGAEKKQKGENKSGGGAATAHKDTIKAA